MADFIKNIEQRQKLVMNEQVDYLAGQVVSKTLAQNDHHSLTLFAFDAGEEISTHKSGGDALITVLDGTGKITIEETEFILNVGEAIVMPAGKPHAVYAKTKFKMFLTVIFDK